MKNWLFSISLLFLASCASQTVKEKPMESALDSLNQTHSDTVFNDTLNNQSLPQQQEMSGTIDPKSIKQRDTSKVILKEMPRPGGQGNKSAVDSIRMLKNKKKQSGN